MKVNVELVNAGKFKTLLNQSPLVFTKAMSRATDRSIKVIQRNAMREAPVNKQRGGGNLRQSIRSRMLSRTRGEVEVGAKYGVFVHEGTRPHIIRTSKKRVLANRRSGQFFGKVVRHPGTKANPFMERAVDNSNRQINKEFNNAVSRALSEITTKK